MTLATASPAAQAEERGMIQRLPAIRGGVQYDAPASHEQERAWQHELSLIAPQNDEVSWLHLSYVSGDPWETNTLGEGFRLARGISRYVVYQMTPYKRIPEFVREDLEGPNPRTLGRWDAFAVCRECGGIQEQCAVCNGTGHGAFVQERPVFVNRYQWELYRRFGCWAQMYWVVQGSKGGHLRRFTPVQAKLSLMNGGPKEPPAIGDLPYAEPDRRTFLALSALDNIRRYDLMIDYADRKPEHLTRGEQKATRVMREQMWTYLSNQLEDRLKDASPLVKHFDNNRPVGTGKYRPFDPEAIHQRFLERD